MTNIKPVSNRVVRSASGSEMRVQCNRNVDLMLFSNERIMPVHLTDVLFVPSCTAKCFSLSAWETSGQDFHW